MPFAGSFGDIIIQIHSFFHTVPKTCKDLGEVGCQSTTIFETVFKSRFYTMFKYFCQTSTNCSLILSVIFCYLTGY